MTNADDVWRDVFVTGLKNAHGVENQALALMDRQIDRARNFTEVAARLKAHRLETEGQILRLETLLDGFDEKPSGLKDAALSLGGNLAAMSHSFAEDEPEERLRQLRLRELRGGLLPGPDPSGSERRL